MVLSAILRMWPSYGFSLCLTTLDPGELAARTIHPVQLATKSFEN